MEPETAGQEAAAADAGEVSQEEAKQPGDEEVRGAQGSHTKCIEVNNRRRVDDLFDATGITAR